MSMSAYRLLYKSRSMKEAISETVATLSGRSVSDAPHIKFCHLKPIAIFCFLLHLSLSPAIKSVFRHTQNTEEERG